MRRVQAMPTLSGVIQVPDMEEMSVEFDMRSNRSLSSSFYFTCTDRLGRDFAEISMGSVRAADHVEVTKKDLKKIRKALDRAVKQERKEARKLQKLARKSDRSSRTRGSSTSSRIALLSATVSDCSVTSDQEILAEIWAMRPSTLMDDESDDELPEIDAELADTRPTEFLFFTGCPDDTNLRELDVGYRRLRSNSRATRYPATPSYATTIPVNPTLVADMPPLFVPRF
ncbi:hypothetical protein P3T76_012600 [Phytophthora citrophthora]|uniref:Uncharacterized protein n=1 Tax=Phytophthora citrophthora TaxID=4793 RepID=A0AAD9G5B1_9STRA|nr:hypothetical protein P3T76_012600 [Phytophthora citrophthora]